MQHASLCRYVGETFVCELSLSLSLFLVTVAFHFRCLKLCLEVLLVVKILTATLVVCLIARFVVDAGIASVMNFLPYSSNHLLTH